MGSCCSSDIISPPKTIRIQNQLNVYVLLRFYHTRKGKSEPDYSFDMPIEVHSKSTSVIPLPAPMAEHTIDILVAFDGLPPPNRTVFNIEHSYNSTTSIYVKAHRLRYYTTGVCGNSDKKAGDIIIQELEYPKDYEELSVKNMVEDDLLTIVF